MLFDLIFLKVFHQVIVLQVFLCFYQALLHYFFALLVIEFELQGNETSEYWEYISHDDDDSEDDKRSWIAHEEIRGLEYNK